MKKYIYIYIYIYFMDKQGWIDPKDKILPCIRILKSGFFFFFSLIEYREIFQKKKKKKNPCIELRLSHEIFSVESLQNITLYLKNGDPPISCISFPFSLRNKNMVKRENSILPNTNTKRAYCVKHLSYTVGI